MTPYTRALQSKLTRWRPELQ